MIDFVDTCGAIQMWPCQQNRRFLLSTGYHEFGNLDVSAADELNVNPMWPPVATRWLFLHWLPVISQRVTSLPLGLYKRDVTSSLYA